MDDKKCLPFSHFETFNIQILAVSNVFRKNGCVACLCRLKLKVSKLPVKFMKYSCRSMAHVLITKSSCIEFDNGYVAKVLSKFTKTGHVIMSILLYGPFWVFTRST